MVAHISETLRTLMPRIFAGDPEPDPYALIEQCESPIEVIFAEEARQWLAQTLEPQVPVVTPYGTFRLDFVAGDVAFECDGKEWHDDPDRDALRDVIVLATGRVQTIYRLQGKDIVHRCDDLMLALSDLEPDLFRPVVRAWLKRSDIRRPVFLMGRSRGGPLFQSTMGWLAKRPIAGLDDLVAQLQGRSA